LKRKSKKKGGQGRGKRADDFLAGEISLGEGRRVIGGGLRGKGRKNTFLEKGEEGLTSVKNTKRNVSFGGKKKKKGTLDKGGKKRGYERGRVGKLQLI